MKAIILFLTFSLSTLAHYYDKTDAFNKVYKNSNAFTDKDIKSLKNTKIVLIPGILAETFTDSELSQVNLSKLVGQYFSRPLKHFDDKYQIETTRIKSSSKDINTTKAEIAKQLRTDKKVIFVAHSLGGLALMEYLLENPNDAEKVKSLIFLQTPFQGSPMAQLYEENPYFLGDMIKRFLPFFNTSPEILSYLSVERRMKYMEENKSAIKKLSAKVPTLTLGTYANKSASLFYPAVKIMKHGCINTIREKCIFPRVYKGTMDQSDGMVPLNSSMLPETPFVKLSRIDHGETVVDIPFTDIDQNKLIESLIKMTL